MDDSRSTRSERPEGDKRSPSRKKSGEATPGTRSRSSASSSSAGHDTRNLVTAQQAIGNFLRNIREAQRLTQEQVALLTKDSPWKLSRAAISAIERGQNFPGMEAMLALSSVLHVDPQELVERAQLSTLVPVDVTEVSYEALKAEAAEFFWAGDYRKALAIYDAMIEKVALENDDDANIARERTARLEVHRATALKRAGALLSAIASTERAISFSTDYPQIQADAYVVLADLQCQRGHLPLARDAAQRAVELSELAEPKTQGWAWMAKARVLYLAEEFEQARQAFLRARERAREANDSRHLTHIEGDVGMCWLGLGQVGEATKWLRRAVDLAREQSQPAMEASWLIELGKIRFAEEKPDEAESLAVAALRIAKPREIHLTIFRAEWLLHCIGKAGPSESPDRHRLHYLRKLYGQLDQHEGIEEIQQFRQTALRTMSDDRYRR